MTKRYLWLDAARGAAAISVMLYHFNDYLGARSLFHVSFIAVDLFFIMSGFVLSHAYGRKLHEGMSGAHYLAVRLIRLYPVYLCATVVGIAYYLVKVVAGMDDAPPLTDLMAILSQNLFLVPNSLPNTVPAGIFPFAPSSWSLSAEMLVSVAYGMLLWRLRSDVRWIIVILSGAIFAYFAWYFGNIDIGWNIYNFNPSLFRALAEFTFGVALYEAVGHATINNRLAAPAILAVIVASLLLLPRAWYVEFSLIAVVFPLFLIMQPSNDPGGVTAKIAKELGRLSYPLYLLHTPVLLWVAGFYKLILHSDPIGLPWFGGVLSLVTIMISWSCAKWVDEPTRRYLNRLLNQIVEPRSAQLR